MSNEELQNVTNLVRVRSIRATLDEMDADVGTHIKDEEHAAMRRTVRAWEQRLSDSIKVRKQRSDAAQSTPPLLAGAE